MFNQYPYQNFNDLNLDYLLKKVHEIGNIVANFINLETIKFADPVAWNIARGYAKGEIVMDVNGNAYVAKKVVPAGVQLNNSDYWLEIFNFADYVRTANSNLTVNVESGTTRATRAYNIDDWILLDDILYRATSAIAFDELLVIGGNIEHFTVEQFIKNFMLWATNTIQQYKNDIDASELAYINSITHTVNTYYSNTQAEIDRLIAGSTDGTEVIDAREEYTGYVATTLKNAIHEQVKNVGFGITLLNEEKETLKDILDFNDADYLTGYNYSGSTGTIVESTPSDISGYIPVAFGDVISFYWRTNAVFADALNESGPKLAYYDNDKNWVKTFNIHSTPLTEKVTIDFDGYVRISFRNDRTLTDYHFYNTRIGINTLFPYDYKLRPNMAHEGYTPMNIKWEYGNYSADGTFSNSRGRKRAYFISNEINDGSIVTFVPNKYNILFRVFPDPLGAQYGNSSQTALGNLLLTDYGYPNASRKIYVQVDLVDASADIDLIELAKEITIYNKPKFVDIMIFSGQSNMAGRGNSTDGVDRCAAYEFRAITDPTRLYPLVDPFGVNENVVGAIDDGALKTGSCVPQFTQAYYRGTGHTVVAISASDGGTGIDAWQQGTARYNDMVQRYNDCVAYLTANNYYIGNTYVIWHQGEHDSSMSVSDYKSKLAAFADAITTDCNAYCVGVLRVGTSTTYPNPNVIQAQTGLCGAYGSHHCVMLYTLCASYESLGLLKPDNLHYSQHGLDLMGRIGGNNLSSFIVTRVKPMMKDLYNNDIYAPYY